MSRNAATLTGFGAVLLWALLAVLTVGTAPLPPLQLNALCFAVAGGVGLAWIAGTGGLSRLARVPPRVYAFGTAGLFGYHLLYFSALRAAPPAAASLVAYLWPLLIVLLSGLLPGERLRPGHVLGAALGFAGAALAIAGGFDGFVAADLPGYALAFGCALTWSTYSVVSRRLGAIPTASVTVFCLASAALSAAAHLALETTVWPADPSVWGAVLALGVGPVGLAFFLWDLGVKQGDIQLLGVASYAAPVLSTGALILAGAAEPTRGLLVAALLIAGGALVAARAGRPPRPAPAPRPSSRSVG